jgi:hypothetical protein
MMHQRYLNISTRLLPNSKTTPTEKAKTARRGKATVNALKADFPGLFTRYHGRVDS